MHIGNTKNGPCDMATLRRLFTYDPETGEVFHGPRDCRDFVRPKRPSALSAWRKKYEGKPALRHTVGQGYLGGNIEGMSFRAHRVVYALHHGRWPRHQIDHKNGKRDDNRPCNLRDVPNSANSKNQGLKSNNTSGITGVFQCKLHGGWIAHMRVNGKYHHLGRYATKEEAAQARKSAQWGHGFSKGHGHRKAVPKC